MDHQAFAIPACAEEPPTVVVVDDDAALRSALKFAFELDGFRVRTHASAEELLAFPTLPARGCLVLDYRLPGTDALALLKTLRQRGVMLPAILITTQPPAAL